MCYCIRPIHMYPEVTPTGNVIVGTARGPRTGNVIVETARDPRTVRAVNDRSRVIFSDDMRGRRDGVRGPVNSNQRVITPSNLGGVPLREVSTRVPRREDSPIRGTPVITPGLNGRVSRYELRK